MKTQYIKRKVNLSNSLCATGWYKKNNMLFVSISDYVSFTKIIIDLDTKKLLFTKDEVSLSQSDIDKIVQEAAK